VLSFVQSCRVSCYRAENLKFFYSFFRSGYTSARGRPATDDPNFLQDQDNETEEQEETGKKKGGKKGKKGKGGKK